MDIIHRRGRAKVGEVQDDLSDPPSYSAVRTHLRLLEEKGHLRHTRDGLAYVYEPTVPIDRARESALQHLVRTFFGGSAEQAMAALLDTSRSELSHEDLDRLGRMIEAAKKEGR